MKERIDLLVNALSKQPVWLVLAFTLLSGFALIINLGLMPLDSDEPTRAMVAFEMLKTGNYIVPKIFGEFYYNKPPLYNWFIILSYQAFGVINELSTRFPTILCLAGYVFTIYAVSKKHFGKRWAWVNALMFLTCGRILLWDSLLGLIDIGFSWVIFTLFYSIYYFFEKRAWYKLFVFAYALAGIAFLLKGLPAIVFVGATLFIWFVVNKEFKRLFYLPHFAGLGVFVLIVGSFYLAYSQYNELGIVFKTLFTESSKRTAVRFGLWPTVLHLFTFPFEMLYHFLPWSLFSLFMLRRDFWKKVKENRFIYFLVMTFGINIVPYWTSVEVFPRYLLMLAPVFFTVSLYFYRLRFKEQTKGHKIIEWVFLAIASLTLLLTWVVFFIPETKHTPLILLKVVVLICLFAAGVYVMWQHRLYRLVAFGWVLLTFRLAFDWFVLPARHADSWRIPFKEKAIAAAEASKSEKLIQHYDGVIGHFSGFYFSTVRDTILPIEPNNLSSENLIICAPNQLQEFELDTVARFNITWEKSERYVVRRK